MLASRSSADVTDAADRLAAEGIAATGSRCDTGEIAEFRVPKATLVTRGLRNLLGGRLRRANRMPLDITVIDTSRQQIM